MNYKIVNRWTDGLGRRWFTAAWSNGSRTTHCLEV